MLFLKFNKESNWTVYAIKNSRKHSIRLKLLFNLLFGDIA